MYTLGDYTLHARVQCSNNFFGMTPYNQLPISILLLLLKGGFSIERKSLSKRIEQKTDYTILGTSKCNVRKLSTYIRQITSQGKHKGLTDNLFFYKTILVEFSACLYGENCKCGIVSILHVYRILERISYALPLLYAKNSNDYKYTYDTFKSFFDSSNAKLGELGFFRKSLDTILDATEKSFLFHYELETPEKHALQNCFLKLNPNFSQNGNFINFDLSIVDSIELLINIRNSFFHALSGKNHISLEELVVPDKTFLKLTHNFINALSFLISKIAEPSLLP